MKARCIIFDGPFPTQDRHGEEIPEWYVGEGDDDGDDIGQGAHFTSYEAGEKVFQIMRARPEPEQPSSYGFGAERFSCALCMMAKKIDLQAATRDPRNHPIYREQCELEITSTFSFQDKQWLSDIAPELLTDDQRTRLALAKVAAEERTQIEGVIPKHLLYVKGWPTVMPTQAEAELLAEVRREIGRVMRLDVKHTEANEVLERYAELMALKAAKDT